MEKEGKSTERDWGKKKDERGVDSSSGGLRISGLKDKKRRMVLSDSDLEEAEKKENPSASMNKNAGECLSNEEGRVEKDSGSSSVGVKPRENIQTDTSRKVLESESDRKRDREMLKDESVAKRSKMEEASNRKMRESPIDLRGEGKTSGGDHVLNRKPMVPAYRLKEATIQGVVLSSVDKPSKSVREEVCWREHPSQRTLQGLEDSGGGSIADKRKESDVSKQEVVRVQGKGGVLKVLRSSMKVGVLEKGQSQTEDHENGNHDESLTAIEQRLPPKQTPLSRGNRVQEKLRSNAIESEGKKSEGKKSSSKKIRSLEAEEEKKRTIVAKEEKRPLHIMKEEKTHSLETKAEEIRVHIDKAENRFHEPKTDKIKFPVENVEKIKSPIIENFRYREGKAKNSRLHEAKSEINRSHKVKTKVHSKNACLPKTVKSDVQRSPNFKTWHNGKENGEGTSGGRSAVKQKVKEQIKAMLLNAGWNIDLRPRKGRAYEDSVYVSPEGTGYWSITKAYAVFQEHLKGTHDDHKIMSGKSSNASTGTDGNPEGPSTPFPSIPMEALRMLKRNVVNKRRKREEIEESRNKGVDGKKRKRKRKEKDAFGRKKERSGANDNVASSSQKLDPQNNNKNQRGSALLVRGANQEDDADLDDYIPYAWKRTVLSWMIDLGIVPANGKVKYMNKKKTRSVLEGRVTRDGINCGCCSKVLSISRFEVHAGSKLNQPYENIYVEETGISLMQSQLNAWEKHEEPERRGFYTIQNSGDDPNDDTCGICGDGGDLICCDTCPSTFHLSCLGIQLPPDDWRCMHCSCKYCGLASVNAAEESSTSVSSLLSCSQCEQKYHHECVPQRDAIPVSSNSLHSSFCGQSCRKVFKGLQKLIGVKNDLEGGFSWSLIHRLDEDSTNLRCSLAQRAVCNSKIAVAFAVMDECFRPFTDQRTGINLIHNVIYSCGSNFKRLDYNGFYTFILERGDEIICVASIRIHGTQLAEMPFIGTRNMYRRQGMCRRLLNGIEAALVSLNVEKLIIPAISELTNTWTAAFGFQPLQTSQKQAIRSLNMLVFPGTGLLEKNLLKRDSARRGDGACMAENKIKHHNVPEVANESSAPSSTGMDTHESDMIMVPVKHDEKEIGDSLSVLDGHISSSSKVTPMTCDPSHEVNSSNGHARSKSETDAKTDLNPEVACLENKSHPGAGDTSENASETTSGPLSCAPSKETFAPCASHLSDVNGDTICDASAHGSQIAEKRITQQDLQLLQKQPEGISAGSCTTNIDTGIPEQNYVCSDGHSIKDQPSLEIAGETLDAAKCDMSSSAVINKSCELRGEFLCSDATHCLEQDSHIVHTGEMASISCDPGLSLDSRTASSIDTQNRKCKSISLPESKAVASKDATSLHVAVSDHSDAVPPESLSNPHGSILVAVPSDLTCSDIAPVVALSGGSLDSKLDTTLAATHHDLTASDKFTAVPVETSHTDGESAAINCGVPRLKLVQDDGLSLKYPVSEMVKEPQDNGCESLHELDANIRQSNSKPVNMSSISASSATSFAGGCSVGEKNEVASGCKQRTCSGYDSAN